jgi:hypothetical protein
MRKAMLLLAVFGLVGLAWAADPFIGTWKMNLAKSKQTGQPLKSFTHTNEAQGDGFKVVQDLVGSEGKATHRGWSGKYDGKDCMITGDPSADTISLTKPNPNTIKYVFKKNGKEVDSGKAVISKEGKTITDVGGGKDEKGQAFTYTIVMEKQ